MSGELIDIKKNVFEKYTIPNGLTAGIYIMRVRYNNGTERRYKLLVK